MSEQWKIYLIYAVMVTSALVFFKMHKSMKKRMFGLSTDKLKAKIDAREDLLLVDVRTPEEFAGGHIPGSVNLPLAELGDKLKALKEHLAEHAETTVVLVCQSQERAFKAVPQFQKRGLRHAWVLLGGVSGWQAAGHRLVR